MVKISERIRDISRGFKVDEFVKNTDIFNFDPDPTYIYPYEYLSNISEKYLDKILKHRNDTALSYNFERIFG